jgi:uncharacterized membrane protein YccF (DUF307 family)
VSFFGNLIWLVFGGFLAGLGYILGGLVLCLTIIGIPFGVPVMRLGVATMAPFGKEVKEEDNPSSLLCLIFNVIWILLFGWEIALAHLVSGAILAITIIGIPFAQQHFKLIVVALFPFSYRLE